MYGEHLACCCCSRITFNLLIGEVISFRLRGWQGTTSFPHDRAENNENYCAQTTQTFPFLFVSGFGVALFSCVWRLNEPQRFGEINASRLPLRGGRKRRRERPQNWFRRMSMKPSRTGSRVLNGARSSMEPAEDLFSVCPFTHRFSFAFNFLPECIPFVRKLLLIDAICCAKPRREDF